MRTVAASLGALLVGGLMVAEAGPGYAAGGITYHVSPGGGSPTCAEAANNGAKFFSTIQAALNCAAGDSTTATSPDTILLTPNQFQEHLTIGAHVNLEELFVTMGEQPFIDGTGNGRVIDNSSPAHYSLSIHQIGIGNGSATNGGGIYNSGHLNLFSTFVSSNTANGGDGAGIYNDGTATISESSLTNNTVANGVTSHGGGLFNAGTANIAESALMNNVAESGGGLYNEGTANITNGTVAGNTGDLGGGGIDNNGTVTVNHSTLSGNKAPDGGGIDNGRNASVINSTLSGNEALGGDVGRGGGIYNHDHLGQLSVTNTTVSKNLASGRLGGLGGGVATEQAQTNLSNALVADNQPASGPDCFGTVSDGTGGHNLIGNNSDCDTAGLTNHDQVGTPTSPIDPQLGPLQANGMGGRTKTMALGPASPAISAANAATCVNPPVSNLDQRSQARRADVRGTCDIGAYDTGGVTITTASLPSGTVGIPYSATLVATGGTTPYTWSIWGGFLPAGLNLNASTGAITGTPSGPPGTANLTVQLIDSSSPAHADVFKALSISIVNPRQPYHPLTPARITDTRTDSGLPNAGKTLGPGSVLNIQVSGEGGVPKTGATAAVLNVTATKPTAQSYLTVWPTGTPRPTASNLNFVAGETVPNLAEVGLGTDGQVSIYNPSGSVDVVVDVEGYTAASTAGTGLYNPLTPARITDTRPNSGFPNTGKTLGPGSILNVQVTGAGGVPATGVSAAVLNVTATMPTAQSYLTVWPTGTSKPTTSNLNFVPNQTVPNRVQVPVGSGGQVSIYNPAGSVDVVVDVGGYFTDSSNPSATGSQFTPTIPARITDTRQNSGLPNAGKTLGPGGSIKVQVSGADEVPPSGVTAAVMNVTVTNTTAQSYLTVWPDGVPQPFVSDLNWVAKETVPNLVVVKLGSDGAVQVLNAAGSTDVVVDVSGFYS